MILTAILLTLYAGCRKDDLYTAGTPPPGSDFSIRNLKALVSSRSGDALSIRTGSEDSIDITLTDDYAVQPDWSIRIVYRDSQGDTIRTLVPCRTGAPFQVLGLNGTTFLQFDRGLNAATNTATLTYNVVTLIPEGLDIDFERFSGVAIIHDLSSMIAATYQVSNDTIRRQGSMDFSELVGSQSALDIRDSPGKPLPCPTFRDSWWERVMRFLNTYFEAGSGEYGFAFGEIGTGESWSSYNGTRPPGGGDGGGIGNNNGNNDPGHNDNDNSNIIVDFSPWANVDFELANKFNNDNGAYDYMVALKQQAQYDSAKKLRYHRILNFYRYLLTIPPDINQNLAYAPGPCPHGGCEAIDIFDYFVKTRSPFATQVILHFTGNTNLTSMALYSWAWKMNDGLSMEKIDEYIAAHPELHGPFHSVGYTLPQVTHNNLATPVQSKFNKLKFLDELCALDDQAISELLLADNHGPVIADAYDFYFSHGETATARDFIKAYLSGFRRNTSNQFEYYMQHWNNTYSYLINIGLIAGSTNFIEALNWLRSHIDVYLAISNEGLLNDNSEFARWGIQYFVDHPNTTVKQFKNWFMGTPEGYDGEYNAAYWDDPANVFAPQTLPSWEEFEEAFPKNEDGGDMSIADIYNLVGGDVLTAKNTYNLNMGCALKLSRALNYTTTVTIPYIPSTPNSLGTVMGADGLYYFLNAEAMNRWMRKVFGCENPNTSIGEYYNSNAKHWTDAQLDKFAPNVTNYFETNDVKGIYSAVAEKTEFGATGHCDLIYSDGTCVRKCYFEQADKFKWLDIWNLH